MLKRLGLDAYEWLGPTDTQPDWVKDSVRTIPNPDNKIGLETSVHICGATILRPHEHVLILHTMHTDTMQRMVVLAMKISEYPEIIEDLLSKFEELRC